MHRIGRLLLAGVLGAGAARAGAPGRDVIYQVAPIDALMAGLYDGARTVGSLKARGDLGIGTLDGLDGELLCLDGAMLQVRADGAVVPVPDDARTPLATVTWFDRDRVLDDVSADSLAALVGRLGPALPGSNLFCAVRADGVFAYVKTRSVPRQQRPYRPLEDAVADQAVFEFRQVRGTLVGFYSPPFARGVAVPGFHLHFVTADRRGGGHLLDLRADRLTVALDPSDELLLALPSQGEFLNADLSPDRRDALRRVESSPR